MHCPKCGKNIPLWSKFCPGCGAPAPIHRWSKVGIAIIFSVLAMGLTLLAAYLVSISNLPNKLALQQMFAYPFVFCFFVFLSLLILKTILSLRRHPISGTIWLLILVGLLSLSSWGAYLAWRPASSLSVAVVKGPIGGAAVSLYEMDANGGRGKLIRGPLTSDASGNVNFFPLYNLPKRLFLEAKGGSYLDEATNQMVYLKDTDVLTAILPAGAKTVAVTPFTHMAAALAQTRIRVGMAPDIAVISANEAVAKQYGLQSILDLPSADNQYGLALAGVAQLAKNLKVRPPNMVEALAKDWSDGTVDGQQNGQAVVVNGGKALGNAGTTGLSNATTQFSKTEKKPAPKEAPITVNPPPVKKSGFHIITASLPAWVSGQPGSYTLTAENGSLPLRWSVKSGALPQGFTLSQDGILSGSYILPAGVTKKIFEPFTVEAKDQKGQTQNVQLSITIAPEAPQITTYNPQTLTVGKSYNEIIARANGGTPPYRFYREASSGPIPMGMEPTANGSEAHLSGSPKAKGHYSFRVCVIDDAKITKCGNVAFDVKEEEAATPAPASVTPATPPASPTTGGKWDGVYQKVCTITSSNLPSNYLPGDTGSCEYWKRLSCTGYLGVLNNYIIGKGAHKGPGDRKNYSYLSGGDIDSSGATTIQEAANDTTSNWTLQFNLAGDGSYVSGTYTYTFGCSDENWTPMQCSCSYSFTGGPATDFP